MSDNKTIIAGVGGIVIGALFAMGADDDTARLRALDTKLDSVEQQIAEIGTLAQSSAETAENTVASATTTQSALGALEESVAALGSQQAALNADQEALSGSVAESLSAIGALPGSDDLAAIDARIADLGATMERRAEALEARMAALGTAPVAPAAEAAPEAAVDDAIAIAPPEAMGASVAAAPAPADASDPPAAVSVGDDAIALAFGHSTMAGETRVFLSRRAGNDVVLALPGGRMVRAGPDAGTADLGDGCTLALAGIDDRMAYLAHDCATGSVAAADALFTTVPAPLTELSSDVETLRQQIGETGMSLGFGESAMLGGQRIILSRMDGQDAVLRLAGGGDLRMGPEAGALVLEDGCSAALAGTAERRAYIAVLCEGETLVARAAPATATAVDASSAPAGSEADPAGAVAEGSVNEIILGAGETASLGDQRIFFSRRSGQDVVLRVVGGGDITVGPFAGSAEVGGCELRLIRMEGNKGVFGANC
ncbi:MAG: hypothetical protein AAF577_16530 [Pseudomonadota bacterium]